MAFDTRNPRLYLASRSPRRRELLTQMGILFDTLAFRSPPRQDDDVDETAHDGEAALVYVERVARLKAEHGWRTVEMRRLMPQLVLAADTTLEFQGEIIGKPTDAGDARAILRRLSGQTHRVLTSVAVAFEGRIESAISISDVTFGAISETEIRRYVATGEPMDKAGAYAFQEHGDMIISSTRGDTDNVIGLPVAEVINCLRSWGY